ncbi:uncharacterized protein [Primulina huaijiensis]|uniref:uncharacterized protein n=1 Tax=Primulina huaijiensis TaxID=1492673 RepID=UPI003CC72769
MTMMQNKRLGVSYYKAWKGKQFALNHLRGDPEESYRTLPAYLFVVKQVNKVTITHLETNSSGRFKYMFLAYGVCIFGFRRMRKIIAIDGTFLKGKYRGVLLLATAQDEDLHQYPIAWAVVDSENEMSWTWFLQKLHELIPDDPDFVIISDIHAAIISSVAVVYKHSHHLHCTWHLSQNIVTHCGKKGGGVELFMQTTYACKMSDFNMLYEKLKNQYPSVASFIEKSSSPNKWSRAFCRAYSGTIYHVPHSRDWKIPDYISNFEMLPPNFKPKRGDQINEEDHLLESLDDNEKRNAAYAMMLDIMRRNVLVKPLDVLENIVF